MTVIDPAEALAAEVLCWQQEHLLLTETSLSWQLDVAHRLATDISMRHVWREIARRNKWGSITGQGVRIMRMVFFAMRAAQEEVKRLPEDEERKRINDVIKAIANLKTAIVRAPPYLGIKLNPNLPGLIEPAFFSWRHTTFLGLKDMPVLCFEDLLEWAEAEAIFTAGVSRPRTIERQNKSPETAVFVRYMGAWFKDEFGSPLKGTIASIATIALNSSDSLTPEDVDRILRDFDDSKVHPPAC